MTRWRDPVERNVPSPLLDLHPLVGQMLARRGISTPEAVEAFLNPDSYTPSPASALPSMDAAVERIAAAIRAKDPICVWGDFDVDGQTSTTVLVQALSALGADVSWHIPVRARESHGVNIEHLAQVIAAGAKLIVTCDTGITAHEAVQYARARGVDMVITDHHDLPPALPDAIAVINPKRLPPEHALATLAGVGVAYKVTEALWAYLQPSNLQPSTLLDLTALGLVADLAILTGDARYLVQRGLDALRHTQRLGLKTMMELAELKPEHLTEEHIGFVLGPRLNALGRLGDANPAVELLTSNDPARVRVLATQLEGLNAQRKLLCDQVYRAAEAQLRDDPSLLAQPVIVLSQAAWPGGVIGIVASRLVERYHRPAILFTAPPGEPARGSARSIEGLNITAAIAEQKDMLLNFGGHPMAAGLALEADCLPEFRRRLGRSVEKMLGESLREEPELSIDGWLPLPEADLALAEQFEKLAPFGPGNEKLVLASHGLTLRSSSQLGKNRDHLKLLVEDARGNQQSILWWGGGSEELPSGKFDLAYTLRASDWRGQRQAQLELVDFRIREEDQIEVIAHKLEIIDYRSALNSVQMLATFNPSTSSGQRLQPSTSIWAEAEHKKQLGGLDRNMLAQAHTLLIWTTPPSREELTAVLETVRPETVIVFAIDPGMDDPKTFLDRLAGLVKFTLNQRAGRTSFNELAAATAQKVAAVRAGLDWLSKRGQVTVQLDAGGELTLTAGGQSDQAAALAAETRLRSLLNETSAFRAHFRKADINTLFGATPQAKQ
jgi:single-stranded-DNA-specific exonuclease